MLADFLEVEGLFRAAQNDRDGAAQNEVRGWRLNVCFQLPWNGEQEENAGPEGSPTPDDP